MSDGNTEDMIAHVALTVWTSASLRYYQFHIVYKTESFLRSYFVVFHKLVILINNNYSVIYSMILFLQGGFVGTLRILPESAPFSIGSDGTVRVKDSTALDRETTTSFTFQVIQISL